MDVRLAPEQVALRDSVAAVVDRLGPKAVGQLDDAERRSKLDAAVAASGWRELRADGASSIELAIVAEELGRGLADAAYLGPTLAAELRGSSVPGETIAFDGVAFDAAGADRALTVVDGQLHECVLEGSDEQVIGTLHNSDLTRLSVPVGIGTVLGPAPDITALGLALTSADLVGIMRGAVDLSVGYARERMQYGAAIGSFQAVQHLLADAFTLTEGSRSIALHAAWAVDALPPAEALAAGAAAKAYCARAARTVCETAIQVHGGIGNTWECLAHVFLRRALVSTDLFGGVGPNLERVLEHHGLR